MKTITIIGAGTGISRAIAERFGEEGFQIVLVARNEEKLKNQVAELADLRIEAKYQIADVGNAESLLNGLKEIKNKFGHSDAIIYNAAAVSVKDILEQDWETVSENMDVTVGGYMTLMNAVLPYCIKNNKGKLFVTGGGFALGGDPQWTSLSVGKAALRNLVQAYQRRVDGFNIHIAHIMVCGFVNPADEKYNPKAISELYWNLFLESSGSFTPEVIY